MGQNFTFLVGVLGFHFLRVRTSWKNTKFGKKCAGWNSRALPKKEKTFILQLQKVEFANSGILQFTTSWKQSNILIIVKTGNIQFLHITNVENVSFGTSANVEIHYSLTLPSSGGSKYMDLPSFWLPGTLFPFKRVDILKGVWPWVNFLWLSDFEFGPWWKCVF